MEILTNTSPIQNWDCRGILPLHFSDKNPLWVSRIYKKDNCVSREFAYKILCLLGAVSAGIQRFPG